MKILVAGDFYPRRRVQEKINKNDYSFLDEVKPFTEKADYSVVNFEGCIADDTDKPIEKNGPNLRCDKRSLKVIKQAGFDCVTLANNHFRDYGNNGVAKTLIACNEYGLDYVGGGNNIKEAEQVLYKTINEKVLAIINICENEFSIADTDLGGSAPLNPIKNYYTIQEAKQNADFVIVIVHGGPELYFYPTPRMKYTYRFFVDAGADAVVNHHQHCISGNEIYKDKPIFYGLGNFCFDWVTTSVNWWEEGYIVLIDFVENENAINYEIAPYMQFSEEPKVSFRSVQKDFYERFDRINRIIADDKLLEDKFDEWCAKNKNISIFEPYNTKISKGLYSRKLLPSFLSAQRLRLILNSIRCESHYDVLITSLKQLNKQ